MVLNLRTRERERERERDRERKRERERERKVEEGSVHGPRDGTQALPRHAPW